MSLAIENNEVDIVIAVLHPNINSFLEEWWPFLAPFHLIIVQDPALKEELQIPLGFDLQVYSKSDMERVASGSSINFSGYSCRYFGYLMSRKKYIISIDDNCHPARNNYGVLVDAVDQHITNLQTPSTPFFFNTLYDPFREGADFVRGYPFSLRQGVQCVISSGLWLNLADYDAPTQIVKPHERNARYVDAVLTVPLGAMTTLSGINVGFNRDVIGPAFVPGLQLVGEGKRRWETLEDIWSGFCAKAICDHLGFGVKTGLPYVHRDDAEVGNAMERLKKECEGVKLMESIVPFFQSLRLPTTAVTADDCVLEIAGMVREKLGMLSPIYLQAANAMESWIKLWKAVGANTV
ncbi:probable inactive UDP-arabinopyranose mutase 2 [Zingiber officinale]|uniref:Uncharacterized protein n=1 Tax=Zingiber officinale TaxID=94328 RepID=A0A8J5HMD8_ZINOF|nr:probable inactive UDP-arabinopyranose mutase 2 [Zingiber officinale]KAG6523734.1 hypothetical protein ZIOFF_013611 [Zingiber officinale]